MSRSLSAAQVIALGEYLEVDFDPSSLTVPQLLGILGYHNIRFPSPYTKPKLIQIFDLEIRPKSAKFKREKVKKENSIASDDGIKDGVTGELIRGPKQAVSVRRSSRRLSRAPSQDGNEEQPAQLEPSSLLQPKRRRSSAQPRLGGPSRSKVTPAEPVLAEESEPEEEVLMVRKVGRNKKNSETAGTQARRISQTLGDDSGWEDNNIFQSGAESSSPAHPSRAKSKTSRKASGPKRSRQSLSAPPQLSPSASPTRAPRFQEQIQRLPLDSKFEPILPPNVVRDVTTPPLSARKTKFSPREHPGPSNAPDLQYKVDDDRLNVDSGAESESAQPFQNAAQQENLTIAEDDHRHVHAVSQRIAEGGSVVSRSRLSTQALAVTFISRFLIAITFLAASGVVMNYKSESASIGFCDAGTSTNRALEELQTQLASAEVCNRENRTEFYKQLGITLLLPGLAPTTCSPAIVNFLPHPTSCTPCPEHAACNLDVVTCFTGYIPRPHLVLRLLSPISTISANSVQVVSNLIGQAANGLPGLGPVAFPPQCVEDPRRKRNIGALGKAIEALLGQERGRRVCAGGTPDSPSEDAGGEAKKWGLEVENLRDTMKRKTASHLLDTFDDTFTEAIQQLVQWGGVILGEDSSGNRFLAHKTPDLTWNCQVTVKSREFWERWRQTIFGLAAAIATLLYSRAQRARRQIESNRVSELVQIALDTLRNQELAHHTDPITAPHPYLSSLQLRDLILQDEHSIPARRRLWDQVERVVEGNANVRTNLEEIKGGDEMRVWRWVGSTGGGPRVRKRVQFEGQKDEAQTGGAT